MYNERRDNYILLILVRHNPNNHVWLILISCKVKTIVLSCSMPLDINQHWLRWNKNATSKDIHLHYVEVLRPKTYLNVPDRLPLPKRLKVFSQRHVLETIYVKSSRQTYTWKELRCWLIRWTKEHVKGILSAVLLNCVCSLATWNSTDVSRQWSAVNICVFFSCFICFMKTTQTLFIMSIVSEKKKKKTSWCHVFWVIVLDLLVCFCSYFCWFVCFGVAACFCLFAWFFF